MGYIKKLKNNELVGGTDKTTIYPVTSTEAVFEEITNGNESSFKSQKTINKEQQNELDNHEERIQAAEAEDIKSITINGSTKEFRVDDRNNVDLTIYTVDNDPEMPSIASNVEDLRNMVGTSTPVLETSHKTRIETLEGGESVTGSVENKIKTKVDSINSSYQDDNNEYVKYSMTQTSGEVANFNIDETNLKNAIASLNTSISGDNIVIRSGSTPSGTGEAGKIYRYVNSSNNTYTDYMYSGGSWIALATHDTSDEQAQVAYYTCTATGSGAQATKQFVGNGSLTYTPSSGGHIKILMGEANTATGTIYLQYNTDSTNTKKPLYYNGEPVSTENTWEAGETIAVYYDPSANSNAGAYFASNAQGGGGKAEKIKYDNSASGLAAENVQGALDEVAESVIFKDVTMSRGNGILFAKWSYNTNYTRTHYIFPVTSEKYIRVTANSDTNAGIGFLKTYTPPTANNQSADFCDGYDNIISIPAGQQKTLPIPLDCAYIIIDGANTSTSGDFDMTPTSTLVNVKTQEVYEEASNKPYRNVELGTPQNGCLFITWSLNSNYKKDHHVIEVNGEKSIKVTANQSSDARIGFLKSYTTPTTSGQEADYCDGYYSTFIIHPGETNVFDIPADCTHIVVDRYNNSSGSNINMLPQSVQLSEDIQVIATDISAPANIYTDLYSTISTTWVVAQQIRLETGGVYKIKITGNPVPNPSNIGTYWAIISLNAQGENGSNFPSGQVRIKSYMSGDSIPSDGWESEYFTVESETLVYLSVIYRFASGSMQMNVYKCEGALQETSVMVQENSNRIDSILEGEETIMPMKLTSDFASKHFIPLTDGFKVLNGYGGVCYLKNESTEYTEGYIGILGEPTDNFEQRFAFRMMSNTHTKISVVVVTSDGEHIVTNNNGSTFQQKWYVDGSSTGMLFPNTIEVKGSDGKLQISIIGAEKEVFVNEDAEIKSVYLKIKNNKDNDVIIDDYVNNGYTTLLKTHPQTYHVPHPMDVFGNKLYVAFYSMDGYTSSTQNGYLAIYSRDFLTGETNISQKTVMRKGDDHEWIAMIIDNDGFMHIMCNCHRTPLVYLYGSVNDIDDIAVSDKLAWDEATYPDFIKNGNNLYAIFRDKASNGGRWKVYSYDYSNGTYSATTDEWVCDGTDNGSASQADSTACPYWQQWYMDKENGWYYNAFCWRSTTDVTSNHDICFIKTQDFITFYNYQDEELSLPITLLNKNACLIKCVSKNMHLFNQQGIKAAVVNGNPVVFYAMDDSDNNTNVFMMSFEDGKRVERKITHYIGNLYMTLHISSVRVPGFTTISIATYDWSRTIYIGKDLSVYDSECIEPIIISKGGRNRMIQDEDWRIYSTFSGYNTADNYLDITHNYGIQTIE